MAKAIWKDQVIAESDTFQELEGNVYFPPQSVRHAFLRESANRTQCPWKGEARYYDVVVNGVSNESAAWYYPNPKPAASRIKDHVAFWRGVRIER